MIDVQCYYIFNYICNIHPDLLFLAVKNVLMAFNELC